MAFDGSSTIGECLDAICRDVGIGNSIRGGMALFADDPQDTSAMHCLNVRDKVILLIFVI